MPGTNNISESLSGKQEQDNDYTATSRHCSRMMTEDELVGRFNSKIMMKETQKNQNITSSPRRSNHSCGIKSHFDISFLHQQEQTMNKRIDDKTSSPQHHENKTRRVLPQENDKGVQGKPQLNIPFLEGKGCKKVDEQASSPQEKKTSGFVSYWDLKTRHDHNTKRAPNESDLRGDKKTQENR